MNELRRIDFQRCLSGIEFEDWTVDLLRQLSIPSNRVGKNDCGVDIIAEAKWKGQKFRFYIQCKYQNKPIGKTPVQEFFAGTAFHREYGRPVVITNNEATFETRRYAKELGVEIISATQWDEFESLLEKKATGINLHQEGLFGLMIAAYLNSSTLIPKDLLEEDKKKVQSKKELKLQIISEFDEAEECVKEAGRLQLKASQYQERALEIQKRALLRNLTYD